MLESLPNLGKQKRREVALVHIAFWGSAKPNQSIDTNNPRPIGT